MYMSVTAASRLAILVFLGTLIALVTVTAHAAADARDTWSQTAAMAQPRSFHAAVRLADGRVFVTGGWCAPARTPNDSQIYDPRLNRWSAAAVDPAGPRCDPLAVLLRDGRVLVLGGAVMGGASGETYDPIGDRWSSTPVPNAWRGEGGMATALADGRVLIIPSLDDGAAALYDPASNTTAPASSMPRAATRQPGNSSTLLPDGRVLVIGVADKRPLHNAPPSVQLFDPVANRWTAAAQLPSGLAPGRTTSLRDGRVLVLANIAPLIYDSVSDRWLRTGRLRSVAGAQAIDTLADGRAFASGLSARGKLAEDIYDAGSNQWFPATSLGLRYFPGPDYVDPGSVMPEGSSYASTALADGRVLLSGGTVCNDPPDDCTHSFVISATAQAYLYTPPASRPILRALSISPRRFAAATSRGADLTRRRGAAIRFVLNEPATVRFTLRRGVAGRRSARGCMAPSRRNRGSGSCTRLIGLAGRDQVQGRPGRNRVQFPGRFQHRPLGAGLYRLVVTPIDRAGRAGGVRELSFQITP
jgi:hypothetical protein